MEWGCKWGSVCFLFILEMGEMWKVWELEVLRGVRKWRNTCWLAMVTDYEWDFDWVVIKFKKSQKRGIWRPKFEIRGFSWWLWGEGVGGFWGSEKSLNLELEFQRRCYPLISKGFLDFCESKLTSQIIDIDGKLLWYLLRGVGFWVIFCESGCGFKWGVFEITFFAQGILNRYWWCFWRSW